MSLCEPSLILPISLHDKIWLLWELSLFRSRECWFCLSSPNVESHLITSVGEYYYCALAKGPLLPDHALIMPIEHMPNTLSLSQECEKELEHLQNSFRAYFKRQGKEAIFFEWAFKRGIHANLQVWKNLQIMYCDDVSLCY